MFDFITEEHRMIQLEARRFAQQEIAPIAAHHDEMGEFPIETVRKMGQLGFMGIEVPEQYGGIGMDTLAYALALIEICKADASHGTIMSVNNSLVCWGLERFGSDEQKEKYLKPLARGEKIGAFCLSEPEAGSDATSQRTTAEDKGDHLLFIAPRDVFMGHLDLLSTLQ